MKRLSFFGLVLTLSFAFGVPLVALEVDDKTVTVTGCLIKAANDDDALLVTTLARGEAPPYTADGTPARRAPSFMRIVYWLDDDDDNLEGHQGRIVEVRGEVEGDIDRGEIKVEREDGRVEIEFKGEGNRRLRARLPLMSPDIVGTSGPADARADSSEYDVIVRKLDVKEVRMIAPSCDGHVR